MISTVGNSTGVRVQCLKQGKLVVTLDLSIFSDLDPTKMSLRKPSCTYSSRTATEVTFVVPITACGTTSVQSEQYIIYENQVLGKAKAGLLVSREWKNFKFSFKCKFKRTDLLVHSDVFVGVTEKAVNTTFTSESGR